VFSSAAVVDELRLGEYPSRSKCLAFIRKVPLLPVVPEIIDVVDTYVRRNVMPRDPRGDALHLALASVHKCDFLITWNCVHLANANKFGHIRVVNTALGLFVPALVTPLELLGGNNAEGEEDEAE
jgi:predicted nucleic acid-binding protein